MDQELEKRKPLRLKKYDYNSTGAYFLTICTQGRKCVLSEIVGTGVLDGPFVELTQYGEIAEKYIKQLNDFYDNIKVDCYVIMPNHIHILLFIKFIKGNGPSGTPVPTRQNSTVARFVSTFKRFCNKEYGENIWQSHYNDHIIRNNDDYKEHIKYIYENPLNWYYDELYSDK